MIESKVIRVTFWEDRLKIDLKKKSFFKFERSLEHLVTINI